MGNVSNKQTAITAQYYSNNIEKIIVVETFLVQISFISEICEAVSNICVYLYTTKAGTQITKWRCGSCNKTDGHKVCSNRYVTDETFTKLFIMGWNEIAEHPEDYQQYWQVNLKGEDVLLRYKTRLLMKHAAAGPIKEFDSALMMAVMDHITVFEDGRLQIKFYDGTEFEVATE